VVIPSPQIWDMDGKEKRLVNPPQRFCPHCGKDITKPFKEYAETIRR